MYAIRSYYDDGGKLPQRSKVNNAHAYLDAPYGIYKTKDGHLAIALTPLDQITKAMNLELPSEYQDKATWFEKRDEIKTILAAQLIKETTQHWLSIFEPLDFRCSDVFNYTQLLNHDAS